MTVIEDRAVASDESPKGRGWDLGFTTGADGNRWLELQRHVGIVRPTKARLEGRDWLASLSVFAWVFLVTFPVAIPFMFMSEADRALRVSNGVAIALLCVVGYAYGRCIGRSPMGTAALTVVCGAGIVAATIALGG